MHNETGPQGFSEYYTEVNLLKKIHHQNFIKLLGCCDDRHALIFEYLGNGTLEKLMRPDLSFSWMKRVEVAYNLCSALVFLHNMTPKPIVHGDVKPENITFDSDGVLKLVDFGISHELQATNDSGTWAHRTQGIPRGSNSYMDPSFRCTKQLTLESDVFAFGIILLQFVTGLGALNLRDLIKPKFDVLERANEKQRLRLIKSWDIVDKNLNCNDWDVADVMKMLSLRLNCSHEERRPRPNLAADVWHELRMIKDRQSAP